MSAHWRVVAVYVDGRRRGEMVARTYADAMEHRTELTFKDPSICYLVEPWPCDVNPNSEGMKRWHSWARWWLLGGYIFAFGSALSIWSLVPGVVCALGCAVSLWRAERLGREGV